VPLEEPPERLEAFPEVVLDKAVVLARIHRAENEPLHFSTGGGGRFDLSPEGTLYLATEELGAFVEVFRGRLVALDEVAARRLALVRLRAKVRLADLTSASSRGFGVTGAIHASSDYALCQRWASALHRHGFDGVVYHVSHDPSGESLGVALFGPPDRVLSKLVVVDDEPIGDELIEHVRERFGVLVLPVHHP
jgi:hypothetical protein